MSQMWVAEFNSPNEVDPSVLGVSANYDLLLRLCEEDEKSWMGSITVKWSHYPDPTLYVGTTEWYGVTYMIYEVEVVE